MKKIRFFLDPINDLEAWLNKMSKKGYRLKSINNFIYDFEMNHFVQKSAPERHRYYA